jgi:hypothetical protein
VRTLLCIVFLALPSLATAQTVTRESFIAALIQHESSDNDWEIGDKELKYPAYGCLQIRQPCVDDVNKRLGTHYLATDCLGNRKLSLLIFQTYMEIYATKERLGHPPTAEDMAKIWNGGPSGCFDGGAVNKHGDLPKKASTRKTVLVVQKNAQVYWAKIREILEA